MSGSLRARRLLAVRGATRALLASSGLALIVLAPAVSDAHGLGFSQLRLRVAGAEIAGEWEIHLADARRALGLAVDVGGEPGFAQLRASEPRLRAYLSRTLTLEGDGTPCPVRLDPAPLAWHAEQSQVLLGLVATCPAEPRRLFVRSELLFDVDPAHRGYFLVEDARVSHVGVFAATRRSTTLDIRQSRFGADFLEFAREGVRHIWGGLDHVLFLLALLLPASLLRAGGTWSRRESLRDTLREAIKVVTAFSAAHSLTLGLAFFGLLLPPARFVEAAIALSVFAAAWNNLRPFLPGRAWLMAFVFGLVHGLGFAGALRNLSLPIHARWFALVAFNVGVELGQVAIVALTLPLLHSAARRPEYPRVVMRAGSFAIAWLAALWVLQRGFGVRLFGADLG